MGQGHTLDEVLRRLARDQWVRLHGTPRVTVLAGGARARRVWQQWLAVGERAGELYDGALDGAIRGAAARAMAEPQVPIAVLAPPEQLAAWRRGRVDRLAAMIDEGFVEVPEEEEEGVVPLEPAAATPAVAVAAAAHGVTPQTVAKHGPGPNAVPFTAVAPEAVMPAAVTPAAGPRRAPTGPSDAALFDARSAAEAALFEALEATPATAGRFELNGYLSVHFGGGPAEVDLLSRRDRIAVEIDGYHHFTDLDAYRRDRRKDLLLQLQGLIVIRLHAEDVMRDPRAGVNAVCQALAHRMEHRP